MKRPYAPRALAKRILRAIPRPKPAIEIELNSPWVQASGFRSIIDVGANVGQFATFARGAFPSAAIYSVEPLPACAATLRQKFAGDTRFEAFECALGDAPAEVEMFQNDFTPSSSLLRMGETHRESFPFTARSSAVKVRVRTLDELFEGREIAAPLLLKVDVQGYESKVLAGGPRILAQAKLLVIEMSLEKLYEDEPLFDQLYRQVHAAGFSMRGMIDSLRRPSDRKPLQLDVLFERRT